MVLGKTLKVLYSIWPKPSKFINIKKKNKYEEKQDLYIAGPVCRLYILILQGTETEPGTGQLQDHDGINVGNRIIP